MSNVGSVVTTKHFVGLVVNSLICRSVSSHYGVVQLFIANIFAYLISTYINNQYKYLLYLAKFNTIIHINIKINYIYYKILVSTMQNLLIWSFLNNITRNVNLLLIF
jgi:uncharacterized membrane protein YcgQ (UPF0703/DUF1980 family)